MGTVPHTATVMSRKRSAEERDCEQGKHRGCSLLEVSTLVRSSVVAVTRGLWM